MPLEKRNSLTTTNDQNKVHKNLKLKDVDCWSFFHEHHKIPARHLVLLFFTFTTDVNLHSSYFWHSWCHMPIWFKLSSSVLVWWACFLRPLMGVSSAWAWAQTWFHENSFHSVSQAGVQVFMGDWTLASIHDPSLTPWKVDPQWSLPHLYELHHHSDCVLK